MASPMSSAPPRVSNSPHGRLPTSLPAHPRERRVMTWHRVLLLALFCGAAAPLGAAANSLRSDVLYALPGRSGQVGFIDLQNLRGSPHYDLVKQRFLPPRFAHFERFIQIGRAHV